MQTVFASFILLFLIGFLWAPLARAEYEIPTSFTSCHNPVGEVKADYPTGKHAIVGVVGLKSGSDKVFAVGNDNYTQCYCPTTGQIGIKTNWLAAGQISKEDQNVLITQGWVYIPNGANWGLSNQPYLAKNIEFICSEGGHDSPGGGGGTSEGGGGNISGQGSGGGEVLGISTLAGTSSNYTKYQVILTILLAIGLIVYGYKIQKTK